MKVLQILPALEGGGVERGTLEIASALVSAGHESWVLSAGGRLVAELEQGGSKHQQWDIGRKHPASLLQVRKLRRWLQEQDFDVLHVRSRMPAWVTYLAWKGIKQHRPRLLTTLHGLHSVSAYSAIMGVGERVIVVSKTTRDYLEQNYPKVNKDKIRLIYRGVDGGLFNPGYRPSQQWLDDWYQQFPQLKGQPVVCLPGRLTRLKGHLPFLQVLKQLRDSGEPVMGVIVGGEDPKRQAYAQEVRAHVNALGLQQAVVFTGHRSDVRDIFAAVDVVVSMSTKPESFGRTVLEALALATPVVAYSHGGVAEILQALYPFGACQLNDTDEVVSRLQQVLRQTSPAVKENNEFLLQNMCQQTLAVYDEILASEPV